MVTRFVWRIERRQEVAYCARHGRVRKWIQWRQ